MFAARHFLVVINPRGGRRGGAAVFDKIKPAFQQAEVTLTSQFTERAGQAIDIARETDLSRFDALCVVGGDGTVHEVVNGLMQRSDRPDFPLGLIPAGTGNTVHQEIGCGDPDAAARWILSNTVCEIDVAEVNTKMETIYAANIIGWGAVVDINRTAERLRRFGRFRYTIATASHLVLPRRRYAQLMVDGEVLQGQALFMMACNTKSTGSRMLLAPKAQIDDGRFDLIFYRGGSFLQMLTLFRRVFRGTHLGLPGLEYRQAASFSLSSDQPSVLNIDGELKGASPFSATVHHRALRLFGKISRLPTNAAARGPFRP